MPVFEPPSKPHEKNKEWRRIAKAGFRDPKILWAEYWQRFNTMTIPVLDEDAYFADAMAAAKDARDRDHLEELLAEKNEERCRELRLLLSKVFCAAFSPQTQLPSKAVRSAALKVSQTGSLDSFLQFVCGVILGWKHCDGEDETRIGARDENDAVDVQGDDGNESVGDPYEYENTFPDMRPSPDWVKDDDAWNEATQNRVYECDEGEFSIPPAMERGGEKRDEAAEVAPSSSSETPQTTNTLETLPSPAPCSRDLLDDLSSPPRSVPSATCEKPQIPPSLPKADSPWLRASPNSPGSREARDPSGVHARILARNRLLNSGSNGETEDRGPKRQKQDHGDLGQLSGNSAAETYQRASFAIDSDRPLSRGEARSPRPGQSTTRRSLRPMLIDAARTISQGSSSSAQIAAQGKSTLAPPPSRKQYTGDHSKRDSLAPP